MHVVLVHPNASDIYSKLEYIEIGWIFTRPGADIYFSFLKQDFHPGPNKMIEHLIMAGATLSL